MKNARYKEYKRIEDLDEYLSVDSIRYLMSKGIDVSTVSTTNLDPVINIAYINQYIQNSINL